MRTRERGRALSKSVGRSSQGQSTGPEDDRAGSQDEATRLPKVVCIMDPLASVEPSRKLVLWATLGINDMVLTFQRALDIGNIKLKAIDPRGLIYYIELPKKVEYLKTLPRFYSLTDLCVGIARQRIFDMVTERNERDIVSALNKMKPDYQQHQRQNMRKFVRSL